MCSLCCFVVQNCHARIHVLRTSPLPPLSLSLYARACAQKTFTVTVEFTAPSDSPSTTRGASRSSRRAREGSSPTTATVMLHCATMLGRQQAYLPLLPPTERRLRLSDLGREGEVVRRTGSVLRCNRCVCVCDCCADDRSCMSHPLIFLSLCE